MSQLIPVQVTQIQQLTPVIREFSFEALEHPLLPFSSGSHIVVHLPLQERILRNAYSLVSDPYQPQRYQIAVRLQEHSRGGSRYLHEHVKEGDVLNVSAPLNLFHCILKPSIMCLLRVESVLHHLCHTSAN